MIKTTKLKAALLAGVAISATPFAAFADALVIYSPQGDANVQWIEAQAEAAGHDVDILRADGGDLSARLEAEKSNQQADIVLGLNDTTMARLKALGLFQAYTPAWADGLPEAYSDADGVVHKFWQTPIVMAYNPAFMDEASAPGSWLDLVEPEYEGKYFIGPVGWGTTRVILSGMLARFMDENGEISDEGWEFMQAFFDGAVTIAESDEKVAPLADGSVLVDTNWFGGAFREAGKAGYDPVLIDSDGGTPVVAEGIAIMSDTEQLAEAQAFVDWFGSAEVMAAYAAEFGQMPAHPAAIALSPADVQEKTQLVSAQNVNWDLVAENIDGWLQKIELEIR